MYVSVCRSCVQWLSAIGRPFQKAASALRSSIWSSSDDDADSVQEQQTSSNDDDDEKKVDNAEKTDGNRDDDDAGEETFKSHRDTRPYGMNTRVFDIRLCFAFLLGPSSVGVDVSFIGYKFMYGLPEHADSFALKSTT